MILDKNKTTKKNNYLIIGGDGFVGNYSYSLHHVGCGVLVEDSHGKQQYSDYDMHCDFASLQNSSFFGCKRELGK